LAYGELISQKQEQLGVVMKEVSQGEGMNLNMYLSVMDSELRNTEETLIQYNTWSTDPATSALRMKANNLQWARVSLVTLKRG